MTRPSPVSDPELVSRFSGLAKIIEAAANQTSKGSENVTDTTRKI
jgi:hypothetical protein